MHPRVNSLKAEESMAGASSAEAAEFEKSNFGSGEQHSQESATHASSSSQGVIALVGTPNSGKTTLFNWLTGSRFKTVNYPGATVDYSIGMTQERYGPSIRVMDTPGTYSLDPKSPDERVTHEAIFSHKVFGPAQLVVAIADATQLSRHLFLTQQLIASGFEVILAVSMIDLLAERGESINVVELTRQLGVPVVLIDGRLGGGVLELVAAIHSKINPFEGTATDSARPQIPVSLNELSGEGIENALRKASKIEKLVVVPRSTSLPKLKIVTAAEQTRRIDKILLHPVGGLLFFAIIMVTFFSAIFWLAAPIMDSVDTGFSALGAWVLSIAPDNLFFQFLSNGVIASLAAVLVFVPQIFILFFGITMLEDSGYLARSATLIDKPLSLLGMGGRSFVPLLSGFACAVPAMMAARTINSRRERWLTLFIIPLMSCSARLPVYALLLSFLFKGDSAWKPGLMLAGLYLGSLVVGMIAALVAGKFLKISDRSFFMMELPVYRRPNLRHVLQQVFSRTKSYVRRAGPAIFTFALILWLASTYPHAELKDASARLDASYAAKFGRVIEPIFEPMGADWRVGVGLISAFAAREVFVSSLAIVFHVAGDDSPDTSEEIKKATLQESLLTKMQEAKAPNGAPLFTVASVLGLVLFFMVALQCLSTVMVAIREGGGWKFAVFQLVVFNILAYGLAVLTVQGLRSVGIS
jgi:ferrous iron transport protein B